MSGENNGGGLLFGIVLGAGFAGMLLLPFYIAQRLGAHVLVALVALLSTLMAINSDSLLAMTAEMQRCAGMICFGAPLAELILAFDKFGMWPFALLQWVMFGLMVFAARVGASQPASER